MDKDTRNILRNVVTNCRQLLEDAVAQVLEGQYGVYRSGRVEDASRMGHLSPDELDIRERIVAHLEHIRSGGFKPADAADQLIREIAFTHLNRLAAYKMMEQRGLIREAVSRGLDSQGFKFYLAYHPDDERLWSTGQQELAYRHFLVWQGEQFADEISVLFSPYDPANFVFPPQRVLDQVLDLINSVELADIWTADETIGWIYQYFTPKELRDKARSESQAPRNSYELAFRNQFYTPRYVVEFLTDNTLGRTWYEMRGGKTVLVDQCRYLVRRPDEVFLGDASGRDDEPDGAFIRGELEDIEPFQPDDLFRLSRFAHYNHPYNWVDDLRRQQQEHLLSDLANGPADGLEAHSTQDLWDCLLAVARADRFNEGLLDSHSPALAKIANEIVRRIAACRRSEMSQEELLRAPVLIPFRELKDPRRLKVLDPACGSGHFLLYAFDLLVTIYEEAWQDKLTDRDTRMSLRDDYDTLDKLRCDIPRLILRHNLHGIDIDRRATQIAALALWLRAQRYYNDHKIDRKNRPAITQGNIVVAEPMPGDRALLDEFVAQLEPPIDQMVKRVFNEMKLAGEAGSLLKIEEAIQDDIARAREEWERRLRQQQTPQQMALLPEWIEKKPEQLALFDVSKITDAEFFDRAEHLVLEALEAYAQRAENGHGLRRRLFADDAAGGFAFIELMRQRYDVVLMNPPFGEPSIETREHLAVKYPTWNKNLLCAFIEQALSISHRRGNVGAIFDRTAVIKSTYEDFRRDILLSRGHIAALGDWGWEVLEANVETTSLIIRRQNNTSASYAAFIDLRDEKPDMKGETLRALLQDIPGALRHERITLAIPETFRSLPNSVIGYDFPTFLRRAFNEFPSIEDAGYKAYQGFALKSEKHFRLWWEISAMTELAVNRMFNGARYSPYWANLRDIAISAVEPEDLPHDSSTRKSGIGKHRKLGVCFGKRGEYFCAHALPKGHIFTVEGQSIPLKNRDEALKILGFLNTPLVRFGLNRYCGQHKYSGYVNLFPFRDFAAEIGIQARVNDALRTYIQAQTVDETLSGYVGLQVFGNLTSAAENTSSLIRAAWKASAECEIHCHNEIVKSYGLSGSEIELLAAYLDQQPSPESPIEDADVDAHCHWFSAHSALSYTIGAMLARWDIRYATGERPIPELPDPFDPLPVCPPGMLQNADGLPATETPPGYPLDIDWDGILVDDPDHPDDIIRRVRGVLEVLWGDRAEAIEQEACEILGVKTLRDYFRKPGSGGFWDDHVKRYSKSRRKAPIYWLLQSSRKNYALWLYYHRLDKDLYYKALINYVQPKLRLERSKLDALRAQLAGAGVAGREAKRLEREVEQQEALMSELQDFHDALERAAQLNLVPDLNDGVVLNIAPLHELVPWKEAATYWKALLKGEYEWSTISQQLRDKGRVK